MRSFNEIDPWKIYGKSEKLFDTYKKKLNVKETPQK